MGTTDKPKAQPAQNFPGNIVFLAYVDVGNFCSYFPRPSKGMIEKTSSQPFPAVLMVYKAIEDSAGNYWFGLNIKVGNEVAACFNYENVLLGGVIGSFQVLMDGLW